MDIIMAKQYWFCYLSTEFSPGNIPIIIALRFASDDSFTIAIHLDGYSINDYAARIGDDPNNISHRLKRAEKKLREILKKRPI